LPRSSRSSKTGLLWRSLACDRHSRGGCFGARCRLRAGTFVGRDAGVAGITASRRYHSTSRRHVAQLGTGATRSGWASAGPAPIGGKEPEGGCRGTSRRPSSNCGVMWLCLMHAGRGEVVEQPHLSGRSGRRSRTSVRGEFTTGTRWLNRECSPSSVHHVGYCKKGVWLGGRDSNFETLVQRRKPRRRR
jgi:hypothetical protein